LAVLSLALALFVIALIAAAFGFGLVGGVAMEAAQVVFFVFLVLAVLALIFGTRRRPVDYF
jgi:uncharacterized membrane protein YtjA (UPF0391 family)